MRKRAPRAHPRKLAAESLDWRVRARDALGEELPVRARARCASGTFVLAMLRLSVTLDEMAEACGIPSRLLRSTLATRGAHGSIAEPLDDGAFARLGAFLGIVTARGLPEARAIAEAEALQLGCVLASTGA